MEEEALDKEKRKRKSSHGWYWARSGGQECEQVGIVAAFGWMFSTPRHVASYTRLYAACGWDSLVCHPHVFNLWSPSRAQALAVRILDELAREVEDRPRPIVFATFSGGAKACLYKIFQVLQRTPGGEPVSTVRFRNPVLVEGLVSAFRDTIEKYNTVRACAAGQIHDSSPVDYVSSLGARFVRHSVEQKLGVSSAIFPLLAQAGAKLADTFFLPHFEQERADFWLTLQQSAKLGPVLFLCCTNDELAPFQTINKFAKALEESGCQVDLVVWDSSEHVGHFRNFPSEYQTAVRSFLDRQSHACIYLEAAVSRGGMEGATSGKLSTIQQEGSLLSMSVAGSGSHTQSNYLHGALTNNSNSLNFVGLHDKAVPMRRLPLNSKL